MTTVVQALSEVMADVRGVGKGGYNKQSDYNFRGIDQVVNAVGPVLRAHKVVVVPHVESYEYGQIEVGHKRSLMGHARVTVTYRFHGPDGDFIDCRTPGEAFDSGDKATAKAMSVAFRTALLQALALPTTDTDPDETTYERASDAVTDPQFITDAELAIAQATTADELDTVREFIKTGVDDGKCSQVDRTRLIAQFSARKKVLDES